MTAEKATGTVPKLRFPEFRNCREWARMPLSWALKEHGLKSDGRSEVHSVSLAKGILPQIEHLGRSFAASNTSHYSLVRPFDVVYTRSPLARYKLGIVKQHKGAKNALVSPLYGVFTPKSRHLGQLIEAYFDSPSRSMAFLDPLAQKGAKNTIQLSNERFLSGALFLPGDENEQQKIADCLGALDDLIAAEGRSLEALRQHKQGLMQRLFPRPGDTVPPLRFPEFADAPEWEKRLMGELSTIVRGGSPRPIDGYLTGDTNGLNWLKIGDVDEGSKYVTRTEQNVRPEALSKTRVIRPGDFILSNSMSFGRPYISKIETCIHDGWIAVTAIVDDLDHEYLYYAISSEASQTYFENQAAGGGVRNLTTEIVKALPLSLCDQHEQSAIAACLSTLDERIAAQTKRLEALNAHKEGLLQQLFPSVEEESR
jgi:type I restriction enzyme S subunit